MQESNVSVKTFININLPHTFTLEMNPVLQSKLLRSQKTCPGSPTFNCLSLESGADLSTCPWATVSAMRLN